MHYSKRRTRRSVITKWEWTNKERWKHSIAVKLRWTEWSTGGRIWRGVWITTINDWNIRSKYCDGLAIVGRCVVNSVDECEGGYKFEDRNK
jgi:hypothetical protein